MEIEIQSKKHNDLLQRTEVRFLVLHSGEGTPRRELIREELAGKLNAKKEQVIIDHMQSDFGIQKTEGYAKIYISAEKVPTSERRYILKRNGYAVKEKKKEGKKPSGEKSKVKPEGGQQKPKEIKAPSSPPAEVKKEIAKSEGVAK